MANEIGSLLVRIGADVTGVVGGFDKAGKSIDGVSTKFDKMNAAAKRAVAAAAAAATAAAAGMAALVMGTAKANDEMGKLAQKAGVTVETFSELRYAGDLAGVTVTSLSTGLKQLSKSIDDNNPAFARLGINLVDANGKAKTTEQVLAEVADAFAGMRDGAAKTALVMKLLGEAGADWIPLFNGGAQGLRNMADEARRAGKVISTEAAEAAAQFNDNLTRLNARVEGLGMLLAGPIIEDLAAMSNAMLAARDATASWFDAFRIGFSATPVAERIVDINSELEKLRLRQLELEQDGGGSLGLEYNELENTRTRIASLTRELETLQGVRERINAAEARADAARDANRDRPDAPGKAAPDDGRAARAREKAAADAARAAAEAAKVIENARKQAIDAEIAQGEHLNEMFVAEKERRTAEADMKIAESQRALEAIRVSLLTEAELEAEAHENRLKQLIEGRSLGLLTEAEYNEMQAGAAKAHADRMTEIEKQANARRNDERKRSMYSYVRGYMGELATLSAGVAQSNRKMFEINKVAGISNAILFAYEGISRTMKEYAFPWNVAMGAAHAAAAFAQINAIRSTSFGGGGGAPSISGSTPAPPVSPVTSGAPGGGQEFRQATTINLHGDTFNGKQVRALIEKLNEEIIEGGMRLVVT